uniref:Uncharacterized protein n=1 Tax=Chromera velia CCMP2878 TaxID=1169474 RepID=A0A0G4GWY0_9ALVE|eukprot:Cvel_23743.t1-p1 / transcript=Cvel_23743.t1 / gene=Cvel_23743 / organism=Chromera_velia_CCMP2878 / gene_product=hypothetical protein / transcript_product=hypothetical protein / location=Cvel_scaffold2485:18715-19287(+) / protein_length=191 / sequence_SO=supercontig / SO=protein_coding / is_pseudo=false
METAMSKLQQRKICLKKREDVSLYQICCMQWDGKSIISSRLSYIIYLSILLAETQNGLFPYTREGKEVGFKVRWRDEKNVERARTFTFAQYGDKAEEEATKLRDEKVSKENSCHWAVRLPEGQSESDGGREAAIPRGEGEKPPGPYKDCLKGISASDLKTGPQSKADVAAIPASEKQRPRKGMTWRESNQT